MVTTPPTYQVNGPDRDAEIRLTVQFGDMVVAYSYIADAFTFWTALTGRPYAFPGDLHRSAVNNLYLTWEWIGRARPLEPGEITL